MIPPPGIIVVLAYGAGLATGLAHFRALWCAALLILVVAGILRPGSRIQLAVFMLGAASGVVARHRLQRHCAALLPAGRIGIEAALREPVGSDGGVATVHPSACTGEVAARFPRGSPLAAGDVVQLEGTWTQGLRRLIEPDGMIAVERTRVVGRERSLEAWTRNGLATITARLYGDRAPLVDALVVGRRSGMDRDLKQAFASSGLVHLLSISGFHIGLICAWLVLLLRRVGLARLPALAFSSAIASMYVAFLGWPAPAVRAGAMAWVLAWLRWRQRAVQPDALLATTALVVMLLDPLAVFDLGGWLSVLSLWGAVRFTRWADQAIAPHLLVQSTASSVGATVATAPVTAWFLGAVAPIGILLNFAAIPVAAVAVPGVMASLLVAPFSEALATTLAAGSGLTLHLLELIATWGARVPFGHLVMPAAIDSAVPWLALLLALCWAAPVRGTRTLALTRLGVAGAAVMWVALVPSIRLPQAGAGRLTLFFVDVGQGDAAVLRTPNGHFVVLDAGPRDERFDAGAERVLPLLEREGAGAIDVLVASHAHLDHVGGFGALLHALPVGTVLEPASTSVESSYRELLSEIGASGAAWNPARRGEAFVVDSVHFLVLHPDTTWTGWGEDVNDDSIVLMVRYGGFRAIFMGDAGVAPEAGLLGHAGPVDLLKVGHHGSRTASSAAWLAELAPHVAIVSVGSHNKYGHPSPEAIERLGAQHATIWRTDQQGTVTVITDGRRVEVRGRSRSEAFDVVAPAATISLESSVPCVQPSPRSSASSWTRNGTTPRPPESSRACSMTSR